MPQLTDTAREGLRVKLDGIVQQMLADGQDDATIQAVVDDFKARHMTEEPESPSMLDLAGTALGQAARSLVTGPIDLVRTVGNIVTESPVADPSLIGARVVGRLVVDPAREQGRKAINAWREGRISEAAGHGAAALLPLLGPAAAHIGEQIGTGDPETMARGVGDLTALAAAPAVARGAGAAARVGGRAAQRAGRSAFLRAAKIPESIAKRTETFRKTGDLSAAEQEIAGTVLEAGRGAIRRKNVDALRAERQQVGQQIGALSEQTAITIPATRLLRAVDDEIAAMQAEAAPAAQIRQALRRREELANRWQEQEVTVRVRPDGEITIDPATAARVREGQVRALTEMTSRPSMSRATARGTLRPGETFEAIYPSRPPASQAGLNELFAVPDAVRMGGRAGEFAPIAVERTVTIRPSNLTGREAQTVKRAAYARNRNRYGSENVPPAIARVDMAMARAIKEAQDAIPGMSALNARFARLKPAAQAMEKALQRVGHHDPIGLTQAVLGAGGAATLGPFGALMAFLPVLQRGGPLSAIGQQLYTGGGAAGRAGSALSRGSRAALLGQLVDEDETDEQ